MQIMSINKNGKDVYAMTPIWYETIWNWYEIGGCNVKFMGLRYAKLYVNEDGCIKMFFDSIKFK